MIYLTFSMNYLFSNYYFLAVLSGLCLNLMPCILPILSIKAMSIVKLANSKEKKALKQSSIATFFGVLIFFFLLACFIGYTKYMKQNYIWGQYFQNEIFLMSAILIMFYFLGASMNYSLFSFKTQKNQKDSILQGLVCGFTIPLISTPCIGPFMSSVITVISSSNDHLHASILIILIGVGLGLPYLLIATMKNPAKIFPKAGNWMNYVRYISFSMLLGTIAWLIWILSQNKSGLLYILAVVSFGIILFSLVKSSKFVIKSIIYLMFAIIGTVVVTNSVKIYMDYKYNKLAKPEAIVFDAEKMDKYIASNKTVVVRFTADWCATCKIMDIYLFSSKEVSDFMETNNVIYMIADLTSDENIKEIKDFTRDNKINGVPAIYIASPLHPEGEIHMGLLKKDEFIEIVSRHLKES